jgi:anti-sigma-K factor RskA
MESEQDELGEDQALLILYLAGELPEDQHAALERRLAGDEALRRELEGLRAAQAMIWREMLAADSAQPLRGVATTAHRKLAGMVRQWAVQRLAKEPAVVSGDRSRQRWAIALAVAAVVAIGSAVYLEWPRPQGEQPVVLVEGIDPIDAPVDFEPAETEPVDDLLVSVGLYELEQELNELAELRSLSQ